nr:MAG TPA: tail protein [Caudoviricetes sp.]
MGGKSSTISTSEQRILSLQVQQSSQGLTLPVVYGRARVAGNLVWYGDFTTYEHKTTTRQGGKGGGGVKQEDVKYTYEAAVMMALCEGEIKGVTRIWRDKEKFSSPASLRLTLYKGGEEQPVWPHLQQAKHAAQAISYSGTAYLCSPNYELTKSAQIYSHNFEVDGKLGYSTSIVDANPRDIIRDLLTNQKYGCGFPVENLGDTDVYGTYCRAAGIFLSPVYSEQQEAQRNIAELLEQTNSAAVFSQGRLKIVPYGDSGLSGNGATYIPNLTPLYDLSDDDFIVSGAEDPVRVERKTNADAYNQVQIEYLDRANDYNIAVAEAKDQANIEQYGIRPKDAVKMHGICDAKVARQVAQLLLQRALYVRNEYEFKLGWKYCLLEPMDLVTLTDGGLGLDKTPVRITEIEEDEDGVLNVKAEDFPFGTASATEYPTQPSLGYSADYNVSPGNAHAPVMFEAPLQLTGGEPEIWLATAGGDMWGGAEVWVSTNGDSYTRVGAVSGKARYGSLTAALPAGAVFDRANTLGVEIGAGQLTGGTEQDSRDLLTLCYADGEFLAYETAELKGVGRYVLGNLTRGAYGSNIDRHEAGRPFVRVDESLFKYPVPRDWIGRTVWVKLVSHNVFGSGAQDLAEVPAYSYRIIGAPLGQVANLRLTSSWAYGREAVLAWDKLDGADTYDVEIYAAGSQIRLRAINGITANGYTYTLADMKADGGQVRNVVFKVRGRAVTGKTGAWAQVVAQNPQLKALTGIQIDSGLRQAFFQCERPSEEDFAGIILWVSDNPACPTVDANRVYDGAETFLTIAKCNGNPLEGGKTYYVRAAGYDSFDKTGLRVSSSAAFTVYDVDVTVRDLAESSLNKALRDKIALIDGSGADSVNARIQTALRKAADDLAAKARELGTKITAEEAVNAEQARQIQTVTAAQGNTAAGLEAEKRARAEGDRAEAQARETLVGRVASAEGSINTLRETVVRSDGARAEEIRQLQAKFTIPDTRNDNRPPSWYYANHPRSTVSEFKQADVLGLSGGFAALETVVPWGDPSGGRIFQTAYLQNGTVMRRKSDTAHTYAGNGVYNYTKDLWTGWAADETADGAQAKADAVRRVAEAAQAAAAQARADIQTVERAVTKAEGDIRAVTERITTLQTSVNGNTASIQTHARSINGLEAQYTVKVDVNGRVAGYGLATTPKNGTPESKFIITADRFGVGAVGKADIFPFTVDTQKNRVGVNGELVVNGKAIIDNLNAGTIHGDKIAANTLNANRLTAGSVTAREMAAGSITADKLNVNNLSAISADMGNISGGSLNIGGGQFTVSSDGSLVAQNAVVRGRIEGESGYFNGTIKASRIEGDVMKIVRMKKTAEGVWEAVVRTEDLPMMVKPDFEVETVNTDHAYRNRSGGVFSVNGVPQEAVRFNKTRLVDVRFDKANRLFRDVEYTVTTGYGWYVLPRNQEVRLRLNLSNGDRLTTPLPCLQTAFLLHTDDEYKKLVGKMVWRKLLDVNRFQVIYSAGGLYRAVYGLPNDIYGLRLKFLTDANTSWANGIAWERGLIQDAIKPYSRDNHSSELRSFERELGQVVQSSAVVLTAQNNWQWMELRDVEVLVPEDRVL